LSSVEFLRTEFLLSAELRRTDPRLLELKLMFCLLIYRRALSVSTLRLSRPAAASALVHIFASGLSALL